MSSYQTTMQDKEMLQETLEFFTKRSKMRADVMFSKLIYDEKIEPGLGAKYSEEEKRLSFWVNLANKFNIEL